MLRVQGAWGPPGVVHGFTTRRAGPAEDPDDTSLSGSLAPHPGRPPAALRDDWAWALRRLGAGAGPERLGLASQVHGATVHRVEGPTGPERTVGEGDALVTGTRGVVLAVRTADCVPVLLAAPGAVGAVHAGWRGAASGVVPAAVHALGALTAAAPDRWWAAIGPSIAGRSYQVGPEVVEALEASGVPRSRFATPDPLEPGRFRADVAAVVAAQLEVLGVGHVHRIAIDTFTDRRLFSHRRQAAASGRQAALIVMEA